MVLVLCPTALLIRLYLPVSDSIDDYALQPGAKEGADPVVNAPVDSNELKLWKRR